MARVFIAILFLGLWGGKSALANEKFGLESLMHSLLQVQDRIARGDEAALPLQAHLKKLLDAKIQDTGPVVGMTPKEVRVLLIFAIIGNGSNAVVEALMEIQKSDKRFGLSRAVIDYRKRNRNQAIKRFASVENMKLDGALLPFIAFAKANLLAKAAPKQAIKQYNLARLSAPGTLLEEATLRRLLALHSAHSDGQSFIAVAKQYARRFLNSPYRQQYLAAIRRGVFKMRRTIPKEEIERLARVMPPPHAAALHMHIVRNGIVSGHLQLASFSIKQIIEIADQNLEIQLDEEQLKLLTLLSKITTVEPQELIVELEKVNFNKLNTEDKKLRTTALKILRAIVEPVASTVTNSIAPTSNDDAKNESMIPAKQDASSAPVQMGKTITETDYKKIDSFISDSEKQLQAIDELLSE